MSKQSKKSPAPEPPAFTAANLARAIRRKKPKLVPLGKPRGNETW